MNRQEFANLLSQTQSMMASSRPPTNLCHQPLASVSGPPLSPRQKFQAHVRTLSDNPLSPPQNTPTTPRRSPQLQHVSSLRVLRCETSSPRETARPSPTWRSSESTLKTTLSNGPQFITEEREVWSRPSPLQSFSSDAFLLHPPEQQNPAVQPSKPERTLRPFAPLAQPVNINDRPRTSRGPKPSQSSHLIDNGADWLQEELEHSARPSKFAEGSMNDRSAGISSSWQEHASLTSCSSTEESDNDTTPRASTQRSSIDVNELKPEPMAVPTFTQRLFKFGQKSKSKEKSKQEPTKAEAEPRTANKRKGLRKSMSMWTLHGDKKKAADEDTNPKSSSPQNKSRVPAQANDIEVLNDRKRRAEEAYAEQIGMKRRKSNVGLVTTSEKQPPLAAQTQAHSKATINSRRRRLSWSSSTTVTGDLETFDGHSDIDNQKRPSRRELEKENQQLRALLRQQDARLRANIPQPTSPSSRPLLQTPGTIYNEDSPPRKSSSKKEAQKPTGKDVPTMPPLPTERMALKTLSNTRNAPQKKSSQGDLQIGAITAFDQHNSDHSGKSSAKHSRRASIARGVGFPRPVSMILEQDEDRDEKFLKENQHPMKNIPTLSPTPASSPKRSTENGATIENDVKIKVQEHIVMQVTGVQRENWEWPEDVF